MTVERKPTKPARPLQLLRALFSAQQAAGEVPAASHSRRIDGASGVVEESMYAGSEDVTRAARAVLHKYGLMPTPVSSRLRIEGPRLLLTLEVSLLHLDSGQELVRVFETEVTSFGAKAAATSLYATALQQLLCLTREPESREVSAPQPPAEIPHGEPPPEDPRPTHRVVYPAKGFADRVAAKVGETSRDELLLLLETGDRDDLAALCQRLAVRLGAKRGCSDPAEWRRAAKVPIEGRIDVTQLQAYARWLLHELDPPPEDSGAAWAAGDSTS
jgi:hypothetical protein